MSVTFQGAVASNIICSLAERYPQAEYKEIYSQVETYIDGFCNFEEVEKNLKSICRARKEATLNNPNSN